VSDPIVREEDAEPALVRLRAGDPRRPRPGLGMLGLCLGTALIIVEANVVNVAVPTIRAELHASATTSLWVLDSYTLLLAVLLLLAGRVGDRIGARRCYLSGSGSSGWRRSAAAWPAPRPCWWPPGRCRGSGPRYWCRHR
jgi:MFS family permease